MVLLLVAQELLMKAMLEELVVAIKQEVVAEPLPLVQTIVTLLPLLEVQV